MYSPKLHPRDYFVIAAFILIRFVPLYDLKRFDLITFWNQSIYIRRYIISNDTMFMKDYEGRIATTLNISRRSKAITRSYIAENMLRVYNIIQIKTFKSMTNGKHLYIENVDIRTRVFLLIPEVSI